MKRKLRATVGILAILSVASAQAGEVETQVKAAMNQLKSKANECKATVQDALGTPFEAQIKEAMDALRADPQSSRLQVEVVDILLSQNDRLTKSLRKAKCANLAEMRDRVVKGLTALSESKQAEKAQFVSRAKETKDEMWKQRYEQLAQVCDRLSRAYSLRAEKYQAVPVTQQLVQIQASLEYLSSVKQVLTGLRDGINTILSDEEALRELQQMSATVDGVQASLKTFADVVLAGALMEGDQGLGGPGQSKRGS